MCAPALCMQSKWTPALTPLYRPPAGSGWSIREMPETFPDVLRASWRSRQKTSNQNGHQAVLEMVNFARLNGVDPTKEIVGTIRAQADNEWCEREPSRCKRKVTIGAASTPRAASPAEIKIVAVKQVGRTPAAPRRGCCGGRGAR